MPAAIYARYSSANQDAASILRQLADCRKYAADRGWTVAHEYVDEARSGRTDQREGFLRCIADAKRGLFDTLIVWDLSRFSRNRDEAGVYRLALRKAGVTLHSATESIDTGTDGGFVLESVLTMLADLESRTIGKRIKAGIETTVRRGFWLGGTAPYGYQVVKVLDAETKKQRPRLAVCETEAAVVRRICGEYAAGKSLRSIIRDLNSDGVKPRVGARWSSVSVCAILKRDCYGTGIIRWGTGHSSQWRKRSGPVIDFQVPTIVDAETWAAVKKRKAEAIHPSHRKDASSGCSVAGLLWCGVCGGRYTTITKYVKPFETRTLGCGVHHKDRKACGNVRHIMEHTIAALLRRVILDSVLTPARFGKWQAEAESARKRPAETRKTAEAGLRSVEGKISRLWAAYEDGGFDLENLRARLSSLESERATFAAQIERGKSEPVADAAVSFEAARQKIGQATGRDLREALKSLGCRVTLTADEICIETNFASVLVPDIATSDATAETNVVRCRRL